MCKVQILLSDLPLSNFYSLRNYTEILYAMFIIYELDNDTEFAMVFIFTPSH